MSLIMKSLTNRQKEILDLIKSYIVDYGFPEDKIDLAIKNGVAMFQLV